MDERLKVFSVMIVDDDRLVLKLVSDVLYNLGFGKIHKCDNGRTAINLLEELTVDFIICDWRLPGMNGTDLVKLIRSGATAANPLTPIIMLTGNAEAHHVMEARDIGANDYLVKPFTVKQLCARMANIVDHPREFVAANSYIGPCRRRKTDEHKGQERRKNKGRTVKVGQNRGK